MTTKFFRLNVKELSDVQDFFIAGHMGATFDRFIEEIYKLLNVTRPSFDYDLYSPRPNPGNVSFKYKRSH